MSVCSVPRMGFFEVLVFQQKVPSPVLSGLLLQLGAVAVLGCLLCAGQSHTGLWEGPAGRALLVLSPAIFGRDLQQELLCRACPGSPQWPWDIPLSWHLWPSSPLELQERMELGCLEVSPGFEAQEHNQDCAFGRRSSWTSWVRRLFLAESPKKCLVLELSPGLCPSAHRAGYRLHFDGSHPPKTLARCFSPVLSFVVTEISLESSLGEGIGIATVFLIKVQSLDILWVLNPCILWLHCGIWQYKAALKSTK